MSQSPENIRTAPSWLKPAVDYGPLVVFLLTYQLAGLLPATAALMAATLVALLLSWLVARKVALVALVTAVLVGVFGGLTLWLNDDSFIKMKPTIIYVLFAAALGAGVVLRKPFLKSVLGEALQLDDDGWRKLTLRFALFFLAMAIANEVVRHAVTTDQWVLWKFPGSLFITFGFMMTQASLIKRHRPVEQPQDDPAAPQS